MTIHLEVGGEQQYLKLGLLKQQGPSLSKQYIRQFLTIVTVVLYAYKFSGIKKNEFNQTKIRSI